jgi:hypothetical protein
MELLAHFPLVIKKDESFVFLFAIQKFKGEDIQNYNFPCFYVRV